MNQIKTVLAILLFSLSIYTYAQDKMSYNYDGDNAIEVSITKNRLTTTAYFSSLTELKSTKKFNEIGININDFFEINADDIQIDNCKSTSKSHFISISKTDTNDFPIDLTVVKIVNNEKIKIRVKSKEKNKT